MGVITNDALNDPTRTYVNPTITRRIRFPARVGVLSTLSSPECATPSRWSPPPVLFDASRLPPAVAFSAGIDRPTVSIIRGDRSR
jgi:hypothetical protein